MRHHQKKQILFVSANFPWIRPFWTTVSFSVDGHIWIFFFDIFTRTSFNYGQKLFEFEFFQEIRISSTEIWQRPDADTAFFFNTAVQLSKHNYARHNKGLLELAIKAIGNRISVQLPGISLMDVCCQIFEPHSTIAWIERRNSTPRIVGSSRHRWFSDVRHNFNFHFFFFFHLYTWQKWNKIKAK